MLQEGLLGGLHARRARQPASIVAATARVLQRPPPDLREQPSRRAYGGRMGRAGLRGAWKPHRAALGASARRTLSLGPRPLFRTAPLRFSMARAADEALSNFT
jgi:hypothetical protein